MAAIPDQPEGIPEDGSDHPAQMPSLAGAIERTRDFIQQWGDGLIEVANGRPLYARDLEVLFRHADNDPFRGSVIDPTYRPIVDVQLPEPGTNLSDARE